MYRVFLDRLIISNLSCISGSFNIMNISSLKCTDLYNFINKSITKNVNNYNASLVTYVNTSLVTFS